MSESFLKFSFSLTENVEQIYHKIHSVCCLHLELNCITWGPHQIQIFIPAFLENASINLHKKFMVA